MYRRTLAFDFDGTLAENGRVPLALQRALEQLHTAGYALFMVTGRRFGDAELGALEDVFTGILWENGAALYHVIADEVYLPFGQVDLRLVEVLERGRAIVSTTTPYDEAVWQALGDSGGDAVVTYDKGMVRVMPPGTAKGTGLERLLRLCGFSPRNAAGGAPGVRVLGCVPGYRAARPHRPYPAGADACLCLDPASPERRGGCPSRPLASHGLDVDRLPDARRIAGETLRLALAALEQRRRVLERSISARTAWHELRR